MDVTSITSYWVAVRALNSKVVIESIGFPQYGNTYFGNPIDYYVYPLWSPNLCSLTATPIMDFQGETKSHTLILFIWVVPQIHGPLLVIDFTTAPKI